MDPSPDPQAVLRSRRYVKLPVLAALEQDAGRLRDVCQSSFG